MKAMGLRPIICIGCLIVLLLMIPTSKQHASETPLSGARPASPAVPHVSTASTYISRGDHHKIRVKDPGLATQLAAQGARLIADYGTFKAFDADSNVAR